MGTTAKKLQKALDNKQLIIDKVNNKAGTSFDINSKLSDVANAIETIETGVDTSDATAIANDILKDKSAYVNGKKIVGTIEEYDGTHNNITDTSTIKGPSIYANGQQIEADATEDIKEGDFISAYRSTSSVVANGGSYGVWAIQELSDNKILFCYTSGNSSVYYSLGTLKEDNSISFTTGSSFISSYGRDGKIIKIAEDKFFIAYGKWSSDTLQARIITYNPSTSSFTHGTTYTLDSSAYVSALSNVTQLPDGRILVFYNSLKCALIGINEDSSLSLLSTTTIFESKYHTSYIGKSILLDNNKVFLFSQTTYDLYSSLITVNDDNSLTVVSRITNVDNTGSSKNRQSLTTPLKLKENVYLLSYYLYENSSNTQYNGTRFVLLTILENDFSLKVLHTEKSAIFSKIADIINLTDNEYYAVSYINGNCIATKLTITEDEVIIHPYKILKSGTNYPKALYKLSNNKLIFGNSFTGSKVVSYGYCLICTIDSLMYKTKKYTSYCNEDIIINSFSNNFINGIALNTANTGEKIKIFIPKEE